MSKHAVEQLIQIVGADLSRKYYIFISIEKRVLACLWLLATPDSYRSVGDRFDLSKGNVHYIFLEFIKIISDKRNIYVIWPANDSMVKTIQYSETKHGFPGVVGAVDGCHIDIKEPVSDKSSYYNRKKRTSILLQGVCNENLYFIDVCVGWPGSVHDARMWKNSPIYNDLKRGSKNTLGGHLLGDSAYPLDLFLMAPYKNNGHLTARQLYYNERQSAARQIIERCFGHLKGRFRRLKALLSLINEISEVIMCCCVLNNILLIHDGDVDVEEFINDINETAEVFDEADADARVVLTVAQNKRNLITQRLQLR